VLCLYDYNQGDTQTDDTGSAAEFLSKPFHPAAFAERVRTILDRKKQQRVLFIDDDAELVMFASRVLREAGYDVLVGGNGNVALATVEVEPVDLVITDLVMREREGLETIMRLRKSHPRLPVIAISGAFGGHFLKSAAALGARAALAKPFSGEELLAAVRSVLES
jgi:DNA-binding response OmpR family regulator